MQFTRLMFLQLVLLLTLAFSVSAEPITKQEAANFAEAVQILGERHNVFVSIANKLIKAKILYPNTEAFKAVDNQFKAFGEALNTCENMIGKDLPKSEFMEALKLAVEAHNNLSKSLSFLWNHSTPNYCS